MAQQVQVELIGKDRASKEIQGVSNTLERMKVSVEGNRAGLGKLDNALKDSAANMLGLEGTAGRLADALLEFAPGGLIGAGLIAGIGLLISNIIESKKEQEEATKKFVDYLDNVNKLSFALDRLNFSATEAGVKNLSREFTVLSFQLLDADAAATKYEQTLIDINRFQKENQGFFGKFFSTADAVSVTYTAKEIKKLGDEAQTAFQKLNELQTKQAELMLQLQGIGMQQLQDDITRLSTLRELNKNGRTTRQEQEDILYLTTKLTNLSKNLGADAQVRLMALTAIKTIQEDTNKANKEAADNEKRLKEQERAEERLTSQLLKRELESRFKAQMKYYEDLANAREMSRNVIQQELQAELSRGVTVVGEGISKDEEQAKKLNDLAEERMRTISSTVNSVAEGLDVMTQGLIDGQNGFLALGNGARAAARGILRAFAQEQIAKGVGALGDAFKATASGNFLSAGLFTKAATKHFAAAALAGVGAGAIGGGAGAGLGAGGFSNTQLGRVNFQGQQPLTIIVQGGSLLDMSNPDTVRSFTSALETVSNRRITINRVGA